MNSSVICLNTFIGLYIQQASLPLQITQSLCYSLYHYFSSSFCVCLCALTAITRLFSHSNWSKALFLIMLLRHCCCCYCCFYYYWIYYRIYSIIYALFCSNHHFAILVLKVLLLPHTYRLLRFT